MNQTSREFEPTKPQRRRGQSATPPPAQPTPRPPTQPGAGQATADGLTTAKRIVATFSVTAGLFYAGLVFAVIGIMLPWGTVAATVFGRTILSQDVSVPGWEMFAVVLIAVAAAWLAWPALSGSPMPHPRLIGLTVSAGLLVGVFAIGLHDFLSAKSENTMGASDVGGVDVSVGSGLLFYAVAVIAIAVGIVRFWMGRSKTPRLT